MQVLNVTDENTQKIEYRVDREVFFRYLNNVCEEYRPQMRMRGFRKGRVPIAMFRMLPKENKEVFYEQTISDILQNAIVEIENFCGSEISRFFDYKVTSMDDDYVFTSIWVHLVPRAIVDNFIGLKIKSNEFVEKLEPTDEDIDKEIYNEREKNAILTSVDRSAQLGDVLDIRYRNTTDHSIDDRVITLGENEISQKLIGKNVGDIVEAKNDNGVICEVEIKCISKKIIPALNDDFVESVSAKSNTVNQYKDEVREDLRNKNKMNADKRKKEIVMEAFRKKVDVDLPEYFIQDRLNEKINEFENRNLFPGMKENSNFIDMLTEITKREATIMCGLIYVANKENIKISDQDIKDKLLEDTHNNEKRSHELYELFRKEPYRKRQFIKEMRLNKAADFVVNNSVIEEDDSNDKNEDHMNDSNNTNSESNDSSNTNSES
jgi:trigger factor